MARTLARILALRGHLCPLCRSGVLHSHRGPSVALWRHRGALVAPLVLAAAVGLAWSAALPACAGIVVGLVAILVSSYT